MPEKPIYFGVTAKLPNEELAREYIDWLSSKVIPAVLREGATSGRIVRLQPTTPAQLEIKIETQYVFPSSSDFNKYANGSVATELKTEGTTRFMSRGLEFIGKDIGEILFAKDDRGL